MYSPQQRAAAALELRRRKRLNYNGGSLAEFLARTKIETPSGSEPNEPFLLWPEQDKLATVLENERLVVILKARQLGISWMTIGYGLKTALESPSSHVLVFSQGQTEANLMIERALYLHRHHTDNLPRIIQQNTTKLGFEHGSTIRSLPATQKAGRSFTASLVILDEFAFMQWGDKLFNAVKPTIDNGGRMIVLSTADRNGSAFHKFWRMASSGDNQFMPYFLPWSAHPERHATWRQERVLESPNPREVKREYPASADEAFALASGLIYEDVYDAAHHVTEDADFVHGRGEVFWAIDDGYSAGSRYPSGIDPATGTYTADAHPRVILLCQLRSDGQLVVFDELYRTKTLEEAHVREAIELGYPMPSYAAVDSSAAQLRGRLHGLNVGTYKATHSVEEGIKELRRWFAPDRNGWRRVLVHPRCVHLRHEVLSYAYDEQSGKPIKAFDHGLDALRYLIWTLRYRG